MAHTAGRAEAIPQIKAVLVGETEHFETRREANSRPIQRPGRDG